MKDFFRIALYILVGLLYQVSLPYPQLSMFGLVTLYATTLIIMYMVDEYLTEVLGIKIY